MYVLDEAFDEAVETHPYLVATANRLTEWATLDKWCSEQFQDGDWTRRLVAYFDGRSVTKQYRFCKQEDAALFTLFWG